MHPSMYMTFWYSVYVPYKLESTVKFKWYLKWQCFSISYRTKIGETAYDTTSPWTNASSKQAAAKTAKATSGPSTQLTTRTSPKGSTTGAVYAAGSAGWWVTSHTPSHPLITPFIGSRGCRAGVVPQAPSYPTYLQGYTGVGPPCRLDATPTTLFYRLSIAYRSIVSSKTQGLNLYEHRCTHTHCIAIHVLAQEFHFISWWAWFWAPVNIFVCTFNDNLSRHFMFI